MQVFQPDQHGVRDDLLVGKHILKIYKSTHYLMEKYLKAAVSR